jgi:hypothetical protein
MLKHMNLPYTADTVDFTDQK